MDGCLLATPFVSGGSMRYLAQSSLVFVYIATGQLHHVAVEFDGGVVTSPGPVPPSHLLPSGALSEIVTDDMTSAGKLFHKVVVTFSSKIENRGRLA